MRTVLDQGISAATDHTAGMSWPMVGTGFGRVGGSRPSAAITPPGRVYSPLGTTIRVLINTSSGRASEG